MLPQFSRRLLLLLALLAAPAMPGPLAQPAGDHGALLQSQWPRTDFTKAAVPLEQIRLGSSSRYAVPPIDEPFFVPVGQQEYLSAREPVIVIRRAGQVRFYPLSILLWHGVVNDVVGGHPVAITYCPLCNAAVVFDRRVGERVLSFAVSGLLRHSDLILYDRQTESLWQQFTGEALAGEMVGARLGRVAAATRSYAAAGQLYRNAQVLSPPGHSRKPYGWTPLKAYDSQAFPPHYPQIYGRAGVAPMDYVVVVETRAWTLDLLRRQGTLTTADGLTLRWQPGMASVLDSAEIAEGRDIGSVDVTRDGQTVPHIVTFAYAFDAFHPDAPLHTQ